MRSQRSFRVVQHPLGSLGLVLGMLASGASFALAQDQGDAGQTRAAVRAAERDKRAVETTPPERSMVERALYWYDNQNVLAKIDVVGIERPTEMIRVVGEKLAATAKKPLHDLRPGSCKTAARTAPGSSWPARGEPAVAFCRS